MADNETTETTETSEYNYLLTTNVLGTIRDEILKKIITAEEKLKEDNEVQPEKDSYTPEEDSYIKGYYWDSTGKLTAAKGEVFKGATATDNGNAGLVPAPTEGAVNNFLCSNGQWKPVEVDYPSGGATGDILQKTSNGVSWVSPPISYSKKALVKSLCELGFAFVKSIDGTGTIINSNNVDYTTIDDNTTLYFHTLTLY